MDDLSTSFNFKFGFHVNLIKFGYTECLQKKLTLLNSLPNKKCETFSGDFYMYGWLNVSSII